MSQTIKINLSRNEPEAESKKLDIQVEIKDEVLYVTGIPDGHKLEYAAWDAETKSKFFIVHLPKEDWDYNSFRLHIGEEKQLVEAQVQRTERFRDGGTTNIDYILDGRQGRLHFPTILERANPTNTYRGKTVELESLI
ncbi:MAG: hypothetical protein WC413_00700 [Candidatus Nanoarchaeia archaeon]